MTSASYRCEIRYPAAPPCWSPRQTSSGSPVLAPTRPLGVRSRAVYSEADATLPFVREADQAVLIGPPPPASSYLNSAAVLAAARDTGAQSIHPGYGFLSENPQFAASVIEAGLTWIGPSPDSMRQMADKINARNLMERAGIPVAAGTREPVADLDAALSAAPRIGYPVMVQAASGRAGIGMSAPAHRGVIQASFESARSPCEGFLCHPGI